MSGRSSPKFQPALTTVAPRRKSICSSVSSTGSMSYASARYWNDRYSRLKAQEEWYESFDQLKSILGKHLDPSQLIMDLGCGDSKMQDSLRAEGFEVLCCDISNVVLQRLSLKDPKREMCVCDGFKIPFKEKSLDVVLDKGTLDAISCDPMRDINPLLDEIFRVLRDGGKYILITPWNAPKRKPLLKKHSWQVEHEVIPMSLQTLATQRFNQLRSRIRSKAKDVLLKMSYRQAEERLKHLDLEKEKRKPPGQSCVMHCYICTRRPIRKHSSEI